MELFDLIPLLALGIVVLSIVFALAAAITKSVSPPVHTRALVRARRTEAFGRNRVRTRHFVTFEFEDGRRKEFALPGHEYGLLAEGDRGTLITRASYFDRFERELPPPGYGFPPAR